MEFACRPIDFVCELPIELGQKILSYLTPLELVEASTVSKSWRSIANADVYWKAVCLKEDITEDYVDWHPEDAEKGLESLEPLCKWASMYVSYKKRILFGWENDVYREPKLQSGIEHIIVNNNMMFQSFFYRKTIDIYKLKNKVFEKVYVIDPAIPGEGSQFLFADHNSLAVSSCNVVTLYANNGNDEYEQEKVFVITPNEAKIGYQVDDIIHENFSDSLLVYCVALFPKYIWIYNELERVVAIFRRNSGSLLKMITYDSRSLFYSNGKDRVYMTSYDSVYMYLENGQVEVHYSKTDYAHKGVCYNDFFIGFIEYQKESNAVCISFKSLNILYLNLKNPFCMTFHPKKDVAYCIGVYEGEFKLYAVSTKTGDEIWSNPLPFTRQFSLHSYTINLIYNKYLVIHPFDRSMQTFSLYNAKTGQHLYNSELGGNILHIDSNFLITRALSSTGRRLEVKMRMYF